MNEHSKELCHWAFGEKKKNHKYIDRIRDTLHNTWKYIYEDKKNAAAKNKQAVKNFADNWRDGADAIKSKVKSTFSRSGKSTMNMAKEKYGLYFNYDTRTRETKVYDSYEDYLKEQEEKKERDKREKRKKIEKAVDDAKIFVNKVLKKIGIDYRLPTRYDNIKIGQKYARNYNDINVPEYVKTPPREVVGKSQMDDGRLVVFRDKKQKEAWDKIKKYQDNEPDFMKNTKNIEPNVHGELPSRAENMEKTNPEYRDNPNASVNCWHCSTAYDLRKRGYDVSTLPIDSEFGSSDLGEFYDVTMTDATGKKIKTISDSTRAIPGSSAQKEAQAAIHSYAMSREDDDLFAMSYEWDYDEETERGSKILLKYDMHDTNDGTYMIHPVMAVSNYMEAHTGASASDCVQDSGQFGECMSNMLNKRLDKFPDGSWGRIGVHWLNGGGHSFVWEKDSNGNITFVDGQTNQTVDIEAYMSDTSPFMPVSISRTDNLEIKEKVLDYVKDSYGKVNKRKDEGG